MKILMTCESFLPRLGGAEIHAAHLIKRFSQMGCEVKLVTHEERTDNFDNDFPVIRLAWNRRNLLPIWRLLWRLAYDADLIHCHYNHRLATFCGLIGRLRGIPVLITLHGMGLLDQPGLSFWAKVTHSFYRSASLRLATGVIATSQDLATIAQKYIAQAKLTLIYNGYDNSAYHARVVAPADLRARYRGKKVIMTVRRLTPKTGIPYLLEAMPHLIKAIPHAVYLIIGDGRMRPEIEKRIAQLGIKDYVEMLGRIDNDRVPQYLRFADVVVFPSTAESSSIACEEAMAMGKKIVASKVGGLVELLGEREERGWLVDLVPWQTSSYDAPPKLPEEKYRLLAQKIVECLDSKDNTRPQAAREFAETNLSWPVIAKKTLEVYQKFV